ncbi:mCG65870 [Mus musculus]|nr:mCG65870 [Mus musculus]
MCLGSQGSSHYGRKASGTNVEDPCLDPDLAPFVFFQKDRGVPGPRAPLQRIQASCSAGVKIQELMLQADTTRAHLYFHRFFILM